MKRASVLPWLLTVCLSIACGSGNTASPTAPSTVTTATRVISLSGNLAFGTIPVGGSFTAVLRINNTGTATLTVTGISGPSGYTASWVSGTIPAGGFQETVVRFSPTAATAYNGTVTVAGDFTSGTNTISISGTGQRELFTKSGSGDTVFDMPLDVARVHVVGTYTGFSSNFIVKISSRLLVNELLGTGWSSTKYDGTLLTGGGGVVSITNSSGVAWSFTEVR